MKSCKPEPGELSSLNSSTSSKKDDGLKRDRESQELNDSEEEGDLLEDEDEVRSVFLVCFTNHPKPKGIYLNIDYLLMCVC